MSEDKNSGMFLVNSIVSARDNQPYVQLSNEKGMIAQFTMSQARQIAMDIIVQASRGEADAMLLRFFKKMDLPMGAIGAMMVDFRDFRAELDDEAIKHDHRIPPQE